MPASLLKGAGVPASLLEEGGLLMTMAMMMTKTMTTIDPPSTSLRHPWMQQQQQQCSSRKDDNAIVGIKNLVLRSTQHSTNTWVEQMGRMEVNNGDGQG